MKNLLCVDGNSILNRSFYGIRPLTNAAGLHTNALYGFCNVLMGKLETLQPAYAVVAFDRKEPTFRHKAYADYKAGRRPMPQKHVLRLLALPWQNWRDMRQTTFSEQWHRWHVLRMSIRIF